MSRFQRAERLAPGPPAGPPQELAELVHGTFTGWGDRPAVCFETRESTRASLVYEPVSFGRLERDVGRYEAVLRRLLGDALDSREGAVVAVLSKNRPERDALTFACYTTGAVTAPIDTEIPRGRIEELLASASPRLVCCPAVQARRLRSGEIRLPATVKDVLVFDAYAVRGDPEPEGPGPEEGSLSTRRLFGEIADTPPDPRPPRLSSRRTVGLYATSGTAGASRFVEITEEAVVSQLRMVHGHFPLPPGEDAILNVGEYSHIAMLIESLVSKALGVPVYYMGGRPEDELEDNLMAVKPSVIMGNPKLCLELYKGIVHGAEKTVQRSALHRVAFGKVLGLLRRIEEGIQPDKTQFEGLLAHQLRGQVRCKLGGKLKYVISSSALLPAWLVRSLSQLGVEVFDAYGLTECSGAAAMNTPLVRREGSVGLPLGCLSGMSDLGVTVRNEGGAPAAPGEPGEIWITGSTLMKRYWQDEAATRAALLDGEEGPRLRTGDVGWLDAAGYLHVQGRRSEFLTLGGCELHPTRLELEIERSPWIQESFVSLAEDGVRLRVCVRFDERKIREVMGEADPRSSEAAARDIVREALADARKRLRGEIPEDLEIAVLATAKPFPRTHTRKVIRSAVLSDLRADPQAYVRVL